MRIQQQLPTEDSVAGEFARMLLTLMGPAVQAPDSSICAAEYLSLGGLLASARQTTVSSLDEAFANTATQMLSELEDSYGLAPRPELSTDARRTRLLAKIRAGRRGSPQGILAAIRTYDPTAQLYEVTTDEISPRTSDGTYPGTDRDVFHITITVSAATYGDTSKRSEIAAITEQMKPAHVSYRIGVSRGFVLDQSRLDIDAL